MQTIQAEMVVTNLVLSRHGSEATAHVTPQIIVCGRESSQISGSITIRTLELRPGQRIKAEFHIIEPEDRTVHDGDTVSTNFGEPA
jgi:hypothetical protein